MEALPPDVAPFAVGEKIAFREDHPEVPGMYGLVKDVGLEAGQIVFDVTVIDPETGALSASRKATMEEIQ